MKKELKLAEGKMMELERREQELERRGQELNKREHELERKGQELNRKRVAIGVKEEESKTRSSVDSNSNFIQHGEEHGLPVEVGEEEEFVEFDRELKSILNKLTSRNWSSLLEKFQSLEIVSEKQLSLCVKLVVEKAVGEPGQAENCAKVCKDMQFKKVQIAGGGGVRFVNIRKLIISLCQKEFEQDGLKDSELQFENGMESYPGFCLETE